MVVGFVQLLEKRLAGKLATGAPRAAAPRLPVLRGTAEPAGHPVAPREGLPVHREFSKTVAEWPLTGPLGATPCPPMKHRTSRQNNPRRGSHQAVGPPTNRGWKRLAVATGRIRRLGGVGSVTAFVDVPTLEMEPAP